MNYQPLFNVLADMGYIETESEMTEIINAVNAIQMPVIVSLTRSFIQKHNRFMASSTQGRLKEMQLALKLLESELEKYPVDNEVVIKNQGEMW